MTLVITFTLLGAVVVHAADGPSPMPPGHEAPGLEQNLKAPVSTSDPETDPDAVDAQSDLDGLVSGLQAKLQAIDNVELLVHLEQHSPADGGVTIGKGRLTARLPNVFRFDWLQPDVMAGSILLVDKERNEAQQYNPIREEIIVQRWDHLAAQQNLGPEIDRWLGVPSVDDFLLESGEPKSIDGKTLPVILARPRETPEILYEFLLDEDTGLVSHFRQFDREGRLVLHGILTDVLINGDIDAGRLTEMPPFARIRYR